MTAIYRVPKKKFVIRKTASVFVVKASAAHVVISACRAITIIPIVSLAIAQPLEVRPLLVTILANVTVWRILRANSAPFVVLVISVTRIVCVSIREER